MTDRFTYDAGPYVLGALSPEERHAFEEHLDGCAQCQAEVRESKIRAQANRFLICRDSFLVTAEIAQCVTKLVLRVRVIRAI